MKSGYTVKKLLEEFWQQSSTVFSKAIVFIPERQAKDIEEKLNASLSKYTSGQEKEAIQCLIDLKESRLDELDDIWIDAINEATSNLPELLLLDQDDLHYSKREGEILSISIGKIGKRIGRSTRLAVHSTSNAFRRMFKKPEEDFIVATREVPFKNLAKHHLFDLKKEISDWKHTQYRFCSRVFEVTQTWMLEPDTKIVGEGEDEILETKSTYKELIGNLISTYQDEHKVHQLAFEEKFNEINKQVARDLELVGTIELSAEDQNDLNIENEQAIFSTQLKTSIQNWGELIDSLSKRVELLVSLMSLREAISNKSSNFIDKSEDFYLNTIIEHHKVLKAEIENAIGDLSGLTNPSIKEISAIGENIYSKASDIVNNQISAPLNKRVEQQYLSGLLEEYIGEVTDLSKNQPERSIIIEDIDIEGVKPSYEIKTVEWQKFVQRMLGKHIASELDSRKLVPDEKVGELIEDYLEVVQIIETNLVVIEEASGKEEEKPLELAQQGLERSLNNIEEIENEIKTIRESIPQLIVTQNESLIDQLAKFLVKQDVSEMKWVEAQLKVKESAGDWSTKFTAQWARFLDRLDILQRFIGIKYREYEQTLRTFLGLTKQVSQSVESTNLATFLHNTDKKFEELPFIYRKLYDFYRDVEATFFIQNPIYFENCRKALELWKTGFPASISILGEKGSGKRTLVRFLNTDVFNDSKTVSIRFDRSYWQKNDIIKTIANNLNLPPTETIEELVVAIKKKRKGRVVIVENLQNTFIRNMEGYEAIRALLYLISETKKEVFWVVTCSRYGWNFLDVVFKVGDYFSHSLETDKLKADDIESLILRRQKASGYQLQFISDASTEKSRAYKKHIDDIEATQEFLKNKYFEKLTNLAEGNATVAMILWIRSIKEFSDSHITIDSLDIINTASLDGLDSLSLFTLSAFIMHDSLTASELSMVLNDNESNCDMTISRLSARGLLVNHKNYYKLNVLIYRQVVRLLKNRNILH